MPVPTHSDPSSDAAMNAGPARESGPVRESGAGLTRRALLGHAAGLAAIATLGLPAPAIAADPPALDLEGFIALSARLTERDTDELDPEIAAGMLAALTDQGHGPALARLAAETGDAGSALGNAILAAWYSGVVGDGADARLLTYTDALLWGPLSFTKPAGWCGGVTGYWAEPPEG